MKYTIESLSQLVHIILKEDPSPSGRERVKKLLEEVVINKEFVDQYLHDGQPQRKVLYEDPDFPDLGLAGLLQARCPWFALSQIKRQAKPSSPAAFQEIALLLHGLKPEHTLKSILKGGNRCLD